MQTHFCVRDVNETRRFKHGATAISNTLRELVIRGKGVREASIHLTAKWYRRNEEGNREIVIHRRMNRRSQTITARHLSIYKYNVRIQGITPCILRSISFWMNDRKEDYD